MLPMTVLFYKNFCWVFYSNVFEDPFFWDVMLCEWVIESQPFKMTVFPIFKAEEAPEVVSFSYNKSETKFLGLIIVDTLSW